MVDSLNDRLDEAGGISSQQVYHLSVKSPDVFVYLANALLLSLSLYINIALKRLSGSSKWTRVGVSREMWHDLRSYTKPNKEIASESLEVKALTSHMRVDVLI